MSNRQRNCSEPSSYKPNVWNGNKRGGKRRRRPTESHGERPEEQHLTQSYQHRSNNRGRQRRGHRQGPSSQQQPPAVPELPELPGMYFDAARGKYFAIASDQSGISGYNRADLEAKKKQQKLMVEVEEHREVIKRQPRTKSLSSLQSKIQRGGLSAEQMERKMAESRLTSIKDSPHSVHDVQNTFTYNEITGCKFLSVSNDGTSLFGCWGGNDIAFSNCLNVSVDRRLQSEAYHLVERDDSSLQNTMGLRFEQSRNSIEIVDPEIVDMCIAPIDSEVTGCLYVTASTMFKRNQLRSRCNVLLHPLAEWSNPENDITLDSPIYNIEWSSTSDHIWSCGWSPNKMYISLGLEDSARICDIVTEKKFLISTRGKQVVCQKFSADGNIIIMCPRGKNVMCSDLRMYSRHCIDNDETDWPDTKKCCFVQPLQSQYRDHVLTQAFDGHLKLWDLRQKTRPVLEYEGHRNEGYKLSCIVDKEERFVFAVGSDGCTRGWSISSGELLCELPSPQPLTANSEFPRIAYSDSWGGQVGNTALVVASGSSINVHQLGL